ncbi:MAG TPA: hypothetical protein VFH18_03575 [Erysipelotrichaceae bacterium]|nr:hypothetical protein [Erysipelotrichaceae bacterium]
MKGAFETALVILFGMMFMVMGIDYMRVVLMNNKARLYAENILAIIEHQNRFDIDVEELIQTSSVKCSECHYQVIEHSLSSDRLWIIVTYPIEMSHLNYLAQTDIRLLTRPLA